MADISSMIRVNTLQTTYVCSRFEFSKFELISGVTGKTSVVANVKLQFIGNDKKRYVISRGIQATKGKAISIKTLDSTLSYLNKDGEFSSLSSKCIEINTEVQRHIGVSEAILNYVIFCHQVSPSGKNCKLEKKVVKVCLHSC